MEDPGLPLGVVLARLFLEGPLPANDLLNLVEKHLILPFYLSIAIIFQLKRFGITYELKVLMTKGIHGAIRLPQHTPVLLIILIVEDSVQ